MGRPPNWIEIFAPRPDAGHRLICFHHAGGAAQFFRDWSNRLPPEWEVCPVQLPGRWSRLREPLFRRMPPLAEATAEGVMRYLDRPFAFFGHSLGALLALEVARELRRRGKPGPMRLFVSARIAPQSLSRPTSIHRLPDADLVEQVQLRYGAFPAEVLASPELLEILLPAMRADMEVFETYEHRETAPLDCPITAMVGDGDTVAPVANVREWQAQTTQSCNVEVFRGGHFYMTTDDHRFFSFLHRCLDIMARSAS